MARSRQLVLNMSATYLRFGVGLVVTLLITPVIINGVGKDDFGLWSLTWATVGLLELLDLGLRTGVVKWVADARGRGDVEARNELVATHLVVFILLSLVAALGVAALSTLYPESFDIPLDQRHKALTLLWIVSTQGLFLALPTSVFHGVLFGEQRIAAINGVQAAVNVAYAVAVWKYLGGGGSVVGLAWLSLGSMVAEVTLLAALAFALVPDLRFPLGSVNLARLRQVFAFSSAMLLINVSNLILLRTDPLIVKLVLPLAAVAVYALALKIAVTLYFLIKQVSNVLAPLLAQLKGEGEDGLIGQALVDGTRFNFALATCLALGGAALADELVIRWVGPDFAASAPVLIVLLAATALAAPPMMAGAVLGMTGHHREAARLALVAAVTNVGVSLTLVGPLGLVGVALGTLLTTCVVDNGLMVRRACLRYGIPYGEHLRRTALPLLLPAAAQLAITLGIKATWPPSTVAAVVAEAIPGGLIFAAAFWLTGMKPEERARVRGFVARRSPLSRGAPAP